MIVITSNYNKDVGHNFDDKDYDDCNDNDYHNSHNIDNHIYNDNNDYG